MRGECELNCLHAVKSAIFCKDGKPIQNPLTHETYLNVSEDKFQKDHVCFVNPNRYECYFGLEANDCKEFENVLYMAKENQSLSCFPDFVFDHGFIEHFRITSYLETKKGAKYSIEENELRKTIDPQIDKTKSEWDKIHIFSAIRSKSWSYTNLYPDPFHKDHNSSSNPPTHSHEFLVSSFKKNWKHHIDSYEQYSGSKQIGIFMVEYSESALVMHENVYDGWIDGMCPGDMRKPEQFNEYRLSRDKTLLRYIYEFKDKIQYVIFWNCSRVEVIRTQNIPYLIKLLPWEYVILPSKITTIESLQNISVHAPEQKNETTDET